MFLSRRFLKFTPHEQRTTKKTSNSNDITQRDKSRLELRKVRERVRLYGGCILPFVDLAFSSRNIQFDRSVRDEKKEKPYRRLFFAIFTFRSIKPNAVTNYDAIPRSSFSFYSCLPHSRCLSSNGVSFKNPPLLDSLKRARVTGQAATFFTVDSLRNESFEPRRARCAYCRGCYILLNEYKRKYSDEYLFTQFNWKIVLTLISISMENYN